MGDGDVCENWEQLLGDTDKLEKHLEKLTTEKPPSCGLVGPSSDADQQNDKVAPTSNPPTQFRLLLRNNKGSIPVTGIPTPAPTGVEVELDVTSEESLRTQYAPPPPPALKILPRPKTSAENKASSSGPAGNDKKSQVTTKSLEQREKEYSEARMRILGDVRFLEEEKEAELENTLSPAEILKMKINQSLEEDEKKEAEAEEVVGSGTTTKSSKNRRKSKNRSTPSASTLPPTSSLSKTESERILRQPKGPDGSTGFISNS